MRRCGSGWRARPKPSAACSPGGKPTRTRPPTCFGGRSGSLTSPAGCWPRQTPHCRFPRPGSGPTRLWQAATVLREHRGDGHFAALAAADIDGCEAVVLRCCLDLRREDLQPVRGWTDEAWDDALSRLAARGWVGADGALTSAGREAHAAVENATDWAAARPWARLGPETTAEIVTVLTPLAQACANVLPYPSPIGVPAPGAVG